MTPEQHEALLEHSVHIWVDGTGGRPVLICYLSERHDYSETPLDQVPPCRIIWGEFQLTRVGLSHDCQVVQWFEESGYDIIGALRADDASTRDVTALPMRVAAQFNGEYYELFPKNTMAAEVDTHHRVAGVVPW